MEKIGGYGGYGPIRVTGSGPLLVQVPKWSMWVPTCRHMKGKVVAPCWQICCWHAKILVRAPGRAMRDVAAIMVTSPWITGCIWSVRCLHVRKLRFSVHSTVVCTCSRCQVKVFVSHSANNPFFFGPVPNSGHRTDDRLARSVFSCHFNGCMVLACVWLLVTCGWIVRY